MHSKALILSLFASSVFATPLKRDVVVTEVDVDTVTAVAYTTVTQGYPTTTEHAHHHKHHHHHHHDSPVTVTTVEPSPTPVAPSHKHKHHHKHHHSAPKPKPEPAHHHASDDSYQGTVIRHHNIHRKNHTAPHIQWDEGLYNTAMKIAQTCVYEHNTEMDGGGYGQNIAAGVPAANISEIITGMFYNGEVNAFDTCYGQENPPNFESWGHFSQVVWAGTTHVACATYDCSSQGLANAPGVTPVFTVCNYGPPGNVEGEYGKDIHQSIGMPTVEWNY